MTTKTTKTTAMIVISALMITFGVPNAFAGSYSPNWSDPGSCTGSSNECANAASDGDNTVVAKAVGASVLREADAHNNRDSSSNNPGSSPEVSVTGSVEKDYKITYDADGNESYGTFASGGYEVYVQAWRNFEDNGWEMNGFSGVVTFNFDSGETHHSGTLTASRTSVGGGDHDLRVSGYHHVWASNSIFGGTTTIDYWNDASYHAETEELCIDTTCN